MRWPDFPLPLGRADAADAFHEALARSARQRVEVGCPGRRPHRDSTRDPRRPGRPGAGAAVALVHAAPVRPTAVKTPWQHRYVRSFAGRR